MNPKEKAKKLVQQFYDDISAHMQWNEAKKCAAIVIDEIIGLADESDTRMDSVIKYWEGVKTEIEQL